MLNNKTGFRFKVQGLRFRHIRLIAPVLLAAVLLPSSLYAQEVNTSAELKAAPGKPAIIRPNINASIVISGDFCEKITTWSGDVSSLLNSRLKKFTDNKTDLQGKLSTRQTTRSQSLAQGRSQAAAERASMYSKLSAKATTDLQKQAVLKFQTDIEAAVKVREAAVDNAQTVYWAGLASVLTPRTKALETATTSFSTAITQAVTEAKAACASTEANASVRAKQTFLKALKAAQSKFSTDRKAVDKASTDIKAVISARNTAVKKAFDDFKTASEAARVELKASMAVKNLK